MILYADIEGPDQTARLSPFAYAQKDTLSRGALKYFKLLWWTSLKVDFILFHS